MEGLHPGESIKLKLESRLCDNMWVETTAPSCALSEQQVFNFYEYEDELLNVVWERVVPVQRCWDPVAKCLDQVSF